MEWLIYNMPLSSRLHDNTFIWTWSIYRYIEYQNKVIDDNICLSFYLQQYIGTMSKINKYILYSMELCLKNKEKYVLQLTQGT
jgi:hypothetical protein